MKKKKVLITREILPDGPNLLREHGLEVEMVKEDRPMPYDELIDQARGFDALITMLSDRIDGPFLEKNSHLKVIANYAVGFNNIDVLAASKRKIAIGNTPDVLTEATAEVAFGLLIAAARSFHLAQNSAKDGRWKNWHPTAYLGQSLKGKTLGVIGMGRIGLRLAEMAARAFNMRVLYTARTAKKNDLLAQQVELEDLLKESDFISIHVPLNEATKKMIGKNEFMKMKSSAVLVNTARGEIIDQEALIDALKNKTIFAAGLDVTDPEPLPMESELFALENAIILPHIGSATIDARREMSLLCARNVIAGLEGRELEAWVNKGEYSLLES
ncbi:MAG: 2-hydroxyacid dehydrogenase [Bacteriovorax sp.]